MTRSTLGAFFAKAVLWMVALTVIWTQVSAWTSYPAASLGHIALGFWAKDWVRTVHKAPGKFEVDTRIPVVVEGRQGELVLDGDAAHFAYGLPLFIALLLASRSRHLLRRILGGYLLLLPFQAFSLLFFVLKQIMVSAPNATHSLGIAPWQMETIALCYQIGTLLLPTVIPVALWLWFERSFVSSVIVEGWMAQQVGEDKVAVE
jgi:hypothetical protein